MKLANGNPYYSFDSIDLMLLLNLGYSDTTLKISRTLPPQESRGNQLQVRLAMAEKLMD